ncbi:sugar phosphate isomerase/epimerase family protein [Cryptosporangium sp. NPDC048952]|uniref:sugar phosphate isomerase/epimerase family protein n=1 Tax=Cryptosporangium sp. NPDC048952 TaxID=3363961 RepID=UPI003718FDA0
MAAHPRISVSGLCFPELSAVETIEVVAGLGVANTSLTGRKVRESGADKVAAAARAHGVRVVTTTGALGPGLRRADADADARHAAGGAGDAWLRDARRDVDNAATVGAGVVYGLTGPRPIADWDESAAAYRHAIAPLVAYAAERGIVLAVEPTSWLYADLTFVHTFHDALRLARPAGLGVCVDFFHVWTEGELRTELRDHGDAVAHVQLSDMVLGDRSLPCRAVPGDGGIPLEELVRWTLDGGYAGVFDVELNGPRVDVIGAAAAERAVTWLTRVLS